MTNQKIVTRIEVWALDRLIAYTQDPLRHPDEQVVQSVISIKENSMLNPILVDKNGNVIAGFDRLLAAQLLGLTEVQVIVLDHLTEAQARGLRIADGKIAANSRWDEPTLHAELAALPEENLNLPSLGSRAPESPATRQIKEEKPLVWEGFDQGEELARLRLWLRKVESRPGKELLCRAIGELLQRDLIRYGLCGGEKGFGVMEEWTVLEGWATKIFYPSDPFGFGLVNALCNPRIALVQTGYNHGKYDLMLVSLLFGKEGRTCAPRRRKPR